MAEFSGMCGQWGTHDSPATIQAVSDPLRPWDSITVGGSGDLSGCIIGPSDARIGQISLRKSAGIYDYEVDVIGCGPKGLGSGWLVLWFDDESGDTYELGLYSSTWQQHRVQYNSGKPNIKSVRWFHKAG